MVADPRELRASAHHLRESATTVRGLATRVALSGDVHWQSATAEVFRGRVEAVAHRLHRTAGHLDAAADCLDRHAHGVEQTLALLHAAGAMARSGIERLSHVPEHALAALHALDSLGVIDPRGVITPPGLFDPRGLFDPGGVFDHGDVLTPRWTW